MSESFLSSLQKEKLEYITAHKTIRVDLDQIDDGVSQSEDFLFRRKGEKVVIFDRVCDHNGGRLSLKGSQAVCPLHAWSLDVESGEYTNARCKKEALISVNEYELDAPYIEVPIGKLKLKTLDYKQKKDVNIRFLNHACLHFSVGDQLEFATDPWVIGSAFCNGWWLAKDSPSDIFEILNECDFIYISHNHPDHLHPNSLEHIRKDMPILTAGFRSRSTVSVLKQYGFTNIIEMDFISRVSDHDNEISFAVLKSGDFRDDSGLLIEIGEFKCLLTVDSNLLNFGKLPSVDLLCSSFAGGASGFPLCFENYSEDEKKTVVTRNRDALKATNIKNLQLANPKYFMPYAGFFTEKAPRDAYVKERNLKNSVEDYGQICVSNDCKLLNVNNDQIFKFCGKELVDTFVDSSPKYSDFSIDTYLGNELAITGSKLSLMVSSYFENSNFSDSLVVELITTDDSFSKVFERFNIDFSATTHVCYNDSIEGLELEKITNSNGNRFLQIKVRRNELIDVLLHGKPWEDLSIGFQCRIYRNPNTYNSEFWFHFTNIYIAGNVLSVNNCSTWSTYSKV